MPVEELIEIVIRLPSSRSVGMTEKQGSRWQTRASASGLKDFFNRTK
ncbi:hypothetical protein HQ587_06230 [bacterium]|nr:hypothetical protein [bacterium]